MGHTFHIPVLGLAFSIDTPLKVARYGISSVISIVDDELIENMRQYYAEQRQKPYERIDVGSHDARARRITAYLDLVHDIVQEQMLNLKNSNLKSNPDVAKYFQLLPDTAVSKSMYNRFLVETDPQRSSELRKALVEHIHAGSVDVNIMSKVDKINKDRQNNILDVLYSDASSALRGFANSKLHSSVILSAGMNPRLYHYLSELPQFLPDTSNRLSKKIVLKVSDYRSAMIQAKYLAKKGICVSEFRVESGLNCGGHAFATDGYLLGPILEEFKQKRGPLHAELTLLYRNALAERGINLASSFPIKLTAQGGVGTAEEHRFLMDYYQLDGIGWGSPFLLVPEATLVDNETLDALAHATPDDFYVSGASPLGVPFNNFKKSSAEKTRLKRVAKGRPGAPCTKKYLISNTEFSEEPICTASRSYQSKKIRELKKQNLPDDEYQAAYDTIVEKLCLCEGLANPAYLKYDIKMSTKDGSVAICPGPNTAYFNRIYSLEEMVSHIYGRINLLKDIERPSMFVNELQLYVQHIEKYINVQMTGLDAKKKRYIDGFVSQIHQGIDYYKKLVDKVAAFPTAPKQQLLEHLIAAQQQLKLLVVKE